MEISRWHSLWARLGATGDADGVYRDLAARYAEPHRSYHTLAHVADCLDRFWPAAHLAGEKDAIESAIWFHDAVCDPGAADNERKSAALAVDVLVGRMGLARTFADSVAALVVATDHSSVPIDADAALLADVDLSILGTTTDEFEAYERGIRAEYAHVQEAAFRAARIATLEGFLARPGIFTTRYFRKRYEGQARTNIHRSLYRLRSAATAP